MTETQYADTPEESGTSLGSALWRYRYLILGVAALLAVLAFGLSFLQSKAYTATTTVIVSDPTSSGPLNERLINVQNLARFVRNQAEFIGSTVVATRTSDLLDGELTPQQVKAAVSATPSSDIDTVRIAATLPAPEPAAELANTVVIAYEQLITEAVADNTAKAIAGLEENAEILETRAEALDMALAENPGDVSLQAQRDAVSAQLVANQQQIDQIALNAALLGSGVQVLAEAQPPAAPVQPQPLRNAVAAGVLGLLAAGAYAWWRSEQSPIAEDRHDPAPVLGAPLLGVVPEYEPEGQEGWLPVITAPESPPAEAYHFVLSALDFAMAETNVSTLLVTSAAPGNGKTLTTLNLAAAASSDGRLPLVIDGDERARGATRRLGFMSQPGLTDLALNDAVDIKDCAHPWQVGDSVRIPFVPAGTMPVTPASLFRSESFRKAMSRLRGRADMTLVDSPPMMAVAETSNIAAETDAVIIIVEQGTPIRLLEDARDRIAISGRPLLGYVFNRATVGRGRIGYGRYQGYGYGYGYGRHVDHSDR